MTSSLGERLQAFVGRPTSVPFRARDPVNQPMIRHWCDVVGDANPVYTDAEAASRSRHSGIVAPPAMLQAWTMRGLGRSEPAGQPPFPTEGAVDALMRTLNEAGFTSIVATNCEQEYSRYLRPGDQLTVSGVIESVSEEKRTALGTGHFVTWLDTFRTDGGEMVGTMRFRVLKFRPPAEAPQAPEAALRPRPVISEDNRFFWEGVERGELLIQRCASCGALRHPPRPMCPNCRSLVWDTKRASGRGTVYSYVIPHHPLMPAFAEPYVVALVELEEGTRLVTNIVDVAPEDVRIGMAVALRITDVDGELTLPLFAPTP